MSPGAPPRDEVDHLALQLARVVRSRFPEVTATGFTLADLEGQLLPWHEARRAMATPEPAAWEEALLRLVAGERDYLVAEPDLRAAARRTLERPVPTLALIRPWAPSPLRLGEALATDAATPPSAPIASIFTPPSGRRRPHGSPVLHLAPSVRATRCCHFCHGRLPEQRRVTFCPHCGIDLTKRQCPACSSELEVHWRFCVTCGRGEERAVPAVSPPPRGAPTAA